MANDDVQTQLLAIVRGGLGDNLSVISSQLELLAALGGQQIQEVRDNTQALVTNANVYRAGSAGEIAKKAASSFGIGLFLSPLITGIAKLFGGSDRETAPEPLTPYIRPASLDFIGATGLGGSGNITPVDYSQDGSPRRVRLDYSHDGSTRQAPAARLQPEYNSERGGERQAVGLQQNVTIQINALDSRSILDRSDDIARALREALLNSHSVNDVLAEI